MSRAPTIAPTTDASFSFATFFPTALASRLCRRTTTSSVQASRINALCRPRFRGSAKTRLAVSLSRTKQRSLGFAIIAWPTSSYSYREISNTCATLYAVRLVLATIQLLASLLPILFTSNARCALVLFTICAASWAASSSGLTSCASHERSCFLSNCQRARACKTQSRQPLARSHDRTASFQLLRAYHSSSTRR